MPTIKDIAQKTGLGLATISKYLNGGNLRPKNRAAVEAAIEELGFSVNELARGLKTNRSRSIGVLIPELSNLFVTSIITVVEDALRKNGYSAIVCDCRTNEKDEAEAVRFLMQKRVDGIINMPVDGTGAHLHPALEAGVPVALVDRMIPALAGRVNAVLVDNAAAARAATSRLLENGHRHIGLILGPRGVYTTGQRLSGYRAALKAAGVAYDEALVQYGDYTITGGLQGLQALRQNPAVTAVFVTNYEMTLGALIAANEQGVRLPDELSLIGFDNQYLARAVRPRLAIVTQPLEEMGAALARLLLRRLEQADAPPEIVTLPAALEMGESVRRL